VALVADPSTTKVAVAAGLAVRTSTGEPARLFKVNVKSAGNPPGVNWRSKSCPIGTTSKVLATSGRT
jgi:hypothetical protein